jgi:hypothetical protein
VDFGGGADEGHALEFQQEHVGRGVDSAGGAVDVERAGAERGREALGTDHLDDVAGGDVFLGAGDVGGIVVSRTLEVNGELGGDWHGPRVVFGRLFEQGDEPFDFGDGIFVGLLGRVGVGAGGVHQHGERLVDPRSNTSNSSVTRK